MNGQQWEKGHQVLGAVPRTEEAVTGGCCSWLALTGPLSKASMVAYGQMGIGHPRWAECGLTSEALLGKQRNPGQGWPAPQVQVESPSR